MFVRLSTPCEQDIGKHILRSFLNFDMPKLSRRVYEQTLTCPHTNLLHTAASELYLHTF